MTANDDFFRKLYESFNSRDIETTIAAMSPDVKWANGMEGGFVYGRDAVREYWTRQFGLINSHVNPLKIESGDKQTVVQVHQVVKDLDDNTISDSEVTHIFQLEDRLVKSFEIGSKET